MGFTSLFKVGTKAEHHPASTRLSSAPGTPPLPPAWSWPSCKQPKTLSFRAHTEGLRSRCSNMDPYTSIVVNSVYSDEDDPELDDMATAASCSFRLTAAEEEGEEEGEEEDVIKGLQSDRLFFDPGGCSILHDHLSASCSSSTSKELHTAHEDKTTSRDLADHQRDPLTAPSPAPPSPEPAVPHRKSHEKRGRRAAAACRPGVFAEELESDNPYRDFRASMGEVATAQGLREWDALEEMLGWYLGANSRCAHRFILAAFVDLLVAIASSPPAPTSGGEPRPVIAPSSSPSFTTTTTSAAATANNDSDSFDSALLVCSSSCSSCSCSCSSSNSCIKFVVDEEELQDDQDGDNRRHRQEEEEEEEDKEESDYLADRKKATAVPDGDAAVDRSDGD